MWVVWVLAMGLLAGALVSHALIPRYEFSTMGASGGSVVVFDRWTGQFQRVDYLPDGQPRATPVIDPF